MRKVRTMLVACVVVGSMACMALAADKTSAPGRSPAQLERPTKMAVVSVRPVSDTAMPGYEQLTTEGGQILYVGKDPILAGADVLGIMAGHDANSMSMKVAVGKGSAVSGRVGIFIGTHFVGAPLATKGPDGTITLVGLEPAQAARLSTHFSTAPVVPTGATITFVPQQPKIEPGSTVLVDAFVSGANDLRAYQVAVDISGGQTGRFEMKDMYIDTARTDWVFADMQAVSAANRTGGRMMGALYSGGVNVSEPKYAGTLVLEASPDALGTFNISLRATEETTLKNPDSVEIAFMAPAPTSIEVAVRASSGPRR